MTTLGKKHRKNKTEEDVGSRKQDFDKIIILHSSMSNIIRMYIYIYVNAIYNYVCVRVCIISSFVKLQIIV